VHGSVILDAVGRVARAVPVIGVVLAIGPRRGILAVERESGLGLVVGKLNGKLASSWKSDGSTVLGRVIEAAATLVVC
jgi:hypothetical protein